MHKIVNPRQTRLFDPFDSVLTEKTRIRLLNGWHGIFRHLLCGDFYPLTECSLEGA